MTTSREDPVARALAYPYPRAGHTIIFDPCDGSHRPAPLTRVADAGRARLSGHGRPVALHDIEIGGSETLRGRVTVVASGSNASVAQLTRKWAGTEGAETIVIAPARFDGLGSVYSAHITAYGAVPATVHPLDGVTGLLHLLFVSRGAMALLDGSESLGVNYVLAEIPIDAQTEAGMVAAPLAYVSRRGALTEGGAAVALAACGHEGLRARAREEPEMLEALKEEVGFDGPLGLFVTRLVEDEAYRAELTGRMARTALRWEIDPGRVVAGG